MQVQNSSQTKKKLKATMKENACQSITKLRQIYISAQKNYKQRRQLKINNIHKPKKKSFMWGLCLIMLWKVEHMERNKFNFMYWKPLCY